MASNHNAEPIDPVAPEDACPNCGERDCDELIWLDDDRIECQRCRTIYRLGTTDLPAPEAGQAGASSA